MALKGIKVVEMMGLAPGPLCGTIMADFGASVTVVQKIVASPVDVLSNGKRMISVNLKSKNGLDIVKKLCDSSDVVIDTFRPGVMERLGLGPKKLLESNPRLIFARLSGYGESGMYKEKAGHDINYVAMSGLLSLLSKEGQPPTPPINLVADFAGGSLLCAMGILLALFERTKSGKGQIIDASMTQGAAYFGTWIFKSRTLPIWFGPPGKNVLDGGLPSYGTYKTKDGKFMAVGALEPQFYSNFLKVFNLSVEDYNPISNMDKCRKTFQEIFLTKTQEEWCKEFEHVDACVTPVLELNEVDKHPYHKERNTFYRNHDDIVVPQPAPLLSRTPGSSSSRHSLPKPGQDTVEILLEMGYNKDEIDVFLSNNDIYCSHKSKL